MGLKVIDLSAQLRRIEFLVPDLIPSGYITFLGAREGVVLPTLVTALAPAPMGAGASWGSPWPLARCCT